MSEVTENTLTAYLGHEFQQRLIWQLLVEPEFAEKIIPNIAIEYFDEPNFKRLFIIMLEYFKEYDKVPNLQNQSIHQAIHRYKTPNNQIEEESLFGVIKRIELWNEMIINKQMLYDGDVVQKATNQFIKQQEYRKSAEYVLDKVKSGEIKSKYIINEIEEKFQKISHIGEDGDDSESIGEGIRKALRKEFRETIPTGIETIDVLTGGGLGKGEIGVILTASGVGKSTLLTKIANNAYAQEKNVAQIIFEDTKDQIKRKHYTIWAKSALSKLNDDDEADRVSKVAEDYFKSMEGKGKLIIKKFSQEDTTIKDIKNWMLSYEKKYGFKFDILILDYLDCLESHKKSPDRNESELAIIKGFEALASDLDIPSWTAVQGNRGSFNSEFVEAHQTGGSIKRIQKAHFFMSVGKTQAQQEANFANIRIIKARFAKDGQAFEDCVFNNDTLEIRIDDPKYKYSPTYKGLKHHDENDVNRIEGKASKLHATISQYDENQLIEKANDITINDVRTEGQKFNDLLRKNREPEIKPNTEFNVSESNVDTNPVIEDEVCELSDIEIMRLEIEAEMRGEKYIPKKKLISNAKVTNDGVITNMHISTTRTDLTQIVEFVNETVKNDGVSDGVNDGLIEDNQSKDLIELDDSQGTGVKIIMNDVKIDDINDGVNPIFDWNGESGTTENMVENFNEVGLEDINNDKSIEIISIESSEPIISIPNDDRNYEVIVKTETVKLRSLSELEKTFIDPDEDQGNNNELFDRLIKKRSHQHVIKKE